ncbi:bombesin receptor-activated protein C6orf89 homolog [Amia ocellicauda]|uniref:bombesin receptor-activated protein C6orf89 homolog n=1 Tax=Amia ocellicauda TaxID=2972642 RepID=UPI003464D458
MGMAPSEPCIYDKLSESIDILRQSGYRYGMSEREIEKFIKQVLETNEPRRDPPQFPILRATLKFVVAVGFLLVAVLVFTYPHSPPQPGLALLGRHNWSSPLAHVRLLSLPIAKKYNLQEFQVWWSARGGVPVNCSGCAGVTAVLEVGGRHGFPRGPHPVLVKGREDLAVTYQHLQQLFSQHRESVSVLLMGEGGEEVRAEGIPLEPSNFTLLWHSAPQRWEEVLQLLFPGLERCPLWGGEGLSLQRCLVTHSTGPQSRAQRVYQWLVVGEGLPSLRVLPVPHCHKLCSSFNLWLGPGDMVYADSRLWFMDLFPGRGQNVVCDGPGF